MAINYTNLFTALGKCIQACNYYASTFSTIKTNGQEFVQVIADQNLDALADGTSNAVSSHISSLTSGCSYWQNKATEILLDPTLVTNNLPITSISLQTVLQELYKDMAANSEYVLEDPIEVGTPSFEGSGNGSLIGMAYLDDISNPVSNPSASSMNYITNGDVSSKASELGISDTVYVKCISADAEGQEQFTIFGNNLVPPFQENSESLGGSINVLSIDQNNLLSNPGFETYSGGFTGWDINDAGGTLVQETTLMYRGASAARINTLANADTITLTQTLAEPLTRGKAYIVGVRFRSVAAETSNNLAGFLQFLDSSDSVVRAWTVSNISISGTSWTVAKGIIVIPFTIDPTDILKFQISLSPTADGVDGIIFDDAFVVPADYFNGVAWCIQNGATRFRTGDLFTVTVNHIGTSVIQKFFRQTYGIQLPSIISGDETIAETLAT